MSIHQEPEPKNQANSSPKPVDGAFTQQPASADFTQTETTKQQTPLQPQQTSSNAAGGVAHRIDDNSEQINTYAATEVSQAKLLPKPLEGIIQREADIEEETETETEKETEAEVRSQPLDGVIQREVDAEEETEVRSQPLDGVIQRKADTEEETEAEVQTLPLAGVIQREADVEEETEAQTKPLDGVVQREADIEETEPLQTKPLAGIIQREADVESETEAEVRSQPLCGVIQPEADTEEEPQEVQTKQIQTKVVVGQPGDKYEQEADTVAAQVMSMSIPPANESAIGRQEEQQEPKVQKSFSSDSITPLVQRQTEEREEPLPAKSLLQRTGKSNTEASSHIESQLNSSKGRGSPLPEEVRSFMEPRFGADFSSVRVHTDSSAVQMNKELGAQAFARGSDIYYGDGKYPGNNELTAHELTHTIQQGGAVRLNKQVQRQAKQAEQETLQAKELPNRQGEVIQNKDVKPVETLAAKELSGYTFQLSLNKELRLKPEETAEEIEAQPIQAKHYTSLDVSSVSPRIQRGWDPIADAKNAILGKVGEFASRIPGYGLLKVILGKDPISETPVERNATNLLQGVLSFVPKGQEFFANLQQSGAIDKAYTWFNQQIAKLNLTWETIKGLFKKAWDSLGAGDILSPGGAFEKIKNVFTEPIGRIKTFAVNAGTKVMEFVFEGAMGGGGAKVMEIVRSAGGAFNTIISDPVKFVGNLVGAVKGGFQQFSGNISSHLKNGLVGWLFGAMAGAGLTLPAQFDLKGIVSLVLQVLGLTYQRLRGMLVKLIGEPKVAKLEKAFDFLTMIVTQGLGAAWEKITEFAGGLQEMVMGGIREWVQNSIITAAISKLLSMFNPEGAVIEAVMAIYNTIMFFIERGSQIAALGEAVFASIGSIAGGNIGAAANYVEQTMGRSLPVMISFLARLIGLGGISEQIKAVIKKIQSPIETAMTKVANFIVQKGKSLLGKDKEDKGNKDEHGKANKQGEPQERVTQAKNELKNKLNKEVVKKTELKTYLSELKEKYDLSILELHEQGEDKVKIFGKINPEFEFYPKKVPIIERSDEKSHAQSEIETFFRAMSIEELRRIIKGKQLNCKLNNKSQPSAEYGITINPNYSVNNLIRKQRNQPNPEDYNYSVLVEIEVEPGTQQYLKENYGRRANQDNTDEEISQLEVHSGGRGIVILKMETIKGDESEAGQKNINYLIFSQNPSDENDPFFQLNSRIIAVRVVGGVMPSGELLDSLSKTRKEAKKNKRGK